MARGEDEVNGSGSGAWWQRPATRYALIALVAAGLLVAFAVRRAPPSPARTPRPGGTEIVAFIPIGQVRRVTEFRWASPVDASRYIVVVRGAGPIEVLRREVVEERLAIGPDLEPRFPAGVYRWTVDALGLDGLMVATLPVQTFEIQ